MHPGLISWRKLVTYAYNACSIPLLLRTLFKPWRMDTGKGSGLTFFERIVFSLLSRVIGFVARVFMILFGLILTLLAVATFPIFFLIPIKIGDETFINLGSFGSSLSYGETYVLNKHARDVAAFKVPKILGKDKALRMIERGLSRDTNRNILLVGEPGSGKTTLVNYLGRLGLSGLSFPAIQNHRVVELLPEDLSIPDFEKSLQEASRAGNVILVIENIHQYEGLFDRLVPYLGSPNLGLVVTTDYANYDGVLKNHREFLSKFEKVDLFETNAEETLAILKENARNWGISINEDALREVVRLSERLPGTQSEPARSLFVLEELKVLGKKITVEDVQQIISDRTNTPIGAIGQDEREVLKGLEEKMREKIVAQDEAVKDVAQALMRLRTGVADRSKPAGSFLFLGPTGVGKTYTAKVLAESYFGRKDAMIRFDMSEFSLDSSVEPFTTRVTAAIEEAPLSLVFLDELEKSNVLVRNLLLQVLDEGRLTRTTGRQASFKDSIIIATSNAGSREIIENPNIDKKALINHLIESGVFSPEFLNRFNGIILFKPLSPEHVKRVSRLLLEEFAERLYADKKIKLEITDALVSKIAEAGFDPDFGARPIKRAIEEIVENKVAEYIMSGNSEGVVKII